MRQTRRVPAVVALVTVLLAGGACRRLGHIAHVLD
jgi:hypothetical protein